MFAKQTWLSASLVAVCSAVPGARAEGEVSPHSDGEAWVDEWRPSDEPKPDELKPEEPKPPTGTFMLGAGFSTDEGFIASAAIAQDNLFNTGTHLSLRARLSARRQLFVLRFADPDVLGTRLGLGFDLYNDARERPGFERRAAGTGLTLSLPIAGKLRGFVGYRIEEVEVAQLGPIARSVQPLPPLTGGLISALRTGLVYDTLDRRDAPLRGTNIGASIEVADRRLGSDLQFTRTDAWAQHHQPLGPLTLHVAGSLSTITGPGGTPRSERLFLDSAHEIRGYSPLAFGPVDSLGTPVGGDAKLLGSIELEVPLVRRIGLSAVGFADAGGLFDRNGSGQVGSSLGFGLLWRSPIGVLRFNWAFTDGGKPAFVFGIGAPW